MRKDDGFLHLQTYIFCVVSMSVCSAKCINILFSVVTVCHFTTAIGPNTDQLFPLAIWYSAKGTATLQEKYL